MAAADWCFMCGHIRSAALGDTLVAPVASLEVQVGGPVVREVVSELAGCAGGMLGDVVGGHGDVEGVAADNLMDMWRRDLAGVDEGVDTVDDNLGTAKPQHGRAAATAELGCRLGERRKGEERRLCSPPHLGRYSECSLGGRWLDVKPRGERSSDRAVNATPRGESQNKGRLTAGPGDAAAKVSRHLLY